MAATGPLPAIALALAIAACGPPPVDIDALLDQAHTHASTGQSGRALAILREAIQRAPNHPGPYLLAARLHLDAARFEAAQTALHRARERGAEPRTLALLTGRLQLRNGQAATLLAELRPETFPDPARRAAAFHLRAQAYLSTGHIDAARDHYYSALAAQPGQPQTLRGLAALALRQGRIADAEDYLRAAEYAQPRHSGNALLRGRIALRRQDYATAAEAYRHALSAAPIPAGLGLSRALAGQGEWDAARQAAEHVLALRPDLPRAKTWTATTALRQGRYREAAESLTQVLRHAPADPRANLLLGTAYLGLGDPARAASHLERTLATHPDDPLARRLLARTRASPPTLDPATLEQLLPAPARDQRPEVAVLLRKATEQLTTGHFQTALDIAVRRIRPLLLDHPRPYVLIGAASLGLGDLATARRSFLRALELDPDNLPARQDLAGLALARNAPELAALRYRNILTDHPDYLPALMGLYRTALARNDGEQAIAWLQRAHATRPLALDPALALIHAYRTRNDVEAARAVLDTLRPFYPRHPDVMAWTGAPG